MLKIFSVSRKQSQQPNGVTTRAGVRTRTRLRTMDATFAAQVKSFRATGNYGSAYGTGGNRSSVGYSFNDEQLQQLAKQAYESNPRGIDGAVYVPALSDYETKVFVHPGSKEVVVAFAGTRPWRPRDLNSDLALARGTLSKTARARSAEAALAAVKRAMPGYHVVVTGHSLGGSLAEHAAQVDSRNEAVSFNPGRRIDKPVGRLVRKAKGQMKASDSIYNSRSYVSRYDVVSAGGYLNRNNKRTTYYTSSKLPWKAHRASYFKK